ncbi:MAG: hypothetical protein PVG49_18765 [Desulfobacteraceae bacterium]|jgi:hypothetical protein
MDWVERERPWVSVDQAVSMSDLRYRCMKIDLFALKTPEDIVDCSDFAWMGTGRDSYRLVMPDRHTLTVLPTIMGNWEVALNRPGKKQTVAKCDYEHDAIIEAERYVREKMPEYVGVLMRDRAWRSQPATEKQIAVLKARRINIPEGLTKGLASRLIGLLS